MVKKIALLGSIALFVCVSSVEANDTIQKRLYIPVAKNVTLQKSESGDSLMIKDYLNSTREMIDGGGALTIKNNYLPYGGSLDPRLREDDGKGNDKLFTSHRKLENLSVYHAGARFYSPTLGQFIQVDTVEGPNRYAYVRGNPISFTDPSGHIGQIDSHDFDYACEDVDLHCKETVASTLVKFNAGIAYSKVRGRDLTADFMSHFLYGDGESLDISDMYQTAALRDYAKERNMDTDEVLSYGSTQRRSVLSSYLAERIFNEYNGETRIKSTAQDLISGTAVRFSGHTVIDASSDDDIKTSLDAYTINFSGDLLSATHHNKDAWNITLKNPEISIYDYYDWDRKNMGVHGVEMRDILPASAVDGLNSIIGKSSTFNLLRFGITLQDRDVATLMDPRIAIGKPFAINGNIHVGTTFNFWIKDEFIKK